MKKINYWFPSLLIAVIIFALSSHQRVQLTEKSIIDFLIFKAGHMFEYAVFFIANYRAVFNTLVKNKFTASKIAIIITVMYAFSDELHQTFVPTREGRLRDVGFDTIGATLALFIIWNLSQKVPKKLLLMAKKLELI